MFDKGFSSRNVFKRVTKNCGNILRQKKLYIIRDTELNMDGIFFDKTGQKRQ